MGGRHVQKKSKRAASKGEREKLRNLIERSVTDSAKKIDLQYSNPIRPLRKKGKDTGHISKSRIKRTRGLQASGPDSTAKQTEYRRSEATSKSTCDKDLIVGAKEVPTIKLRMLQRQSRQRRPILKTI